MSILHENPQKINPPRPNESKQRTAAFLCIVLGILARWLWTIGRPYVQDPGLGLHFGPPLVILMQIVLSLIAAALIFVSAYSTINRIQNESWQVYFACFGCGFMWEIAFEQLQLFG